LRRPGHPDRTDECRGQEITTMQGILASL